MERYGVVFVKVNFRRKNMFQRFKKKKDAVSFKKTLDFVLKIE
jgi:hypothetical protein